jgi:MerR-like DNA binding protein
MPITTDGTTGFGSGKRKRKRPKRGNVIHVAFGASGGRVAGPHDAKSALPGTIPPPAREPVTDLFTRREVAKLLGVSEVRLRSLDRSKIVSPSGQRGKQRAYTFQDLIALRATRELLDHDVPSAPCATFCRESRARFKSFVSSATGGESSCVLSTGASSR